MKHIDYKDPQFVEDPFGNKYWYVNGKHHRVDGPAVELFTGTKFWYINGSIHREDGPAVEWSNGDKEWYYYGEEIDCSSKEEFERIIKLRMFW